MKRLARSPNWSISFSPTLMVVMIVTRSTVIFLLTPLTSGRQAGPGIYTESRAFLFLPYSPNDIKGVFCEVGLSLLLLGVCGLFLLYYLQSLDHLEGQAHYATLLALVLDVDGLLVMVDEDLRHKPAVVVESLRPLWDILVLYLFRLLAHPRVLLSSR